MGLMNAAEALAEAVWKRYCRAEKPPPVWVERQIRPEWPLQETRFRLVEFTGVDGYRSRGAGWSAISAEQLQVMVGVPVAADRGTGHVPRAPEPLPELVFGPFWVVRLARPRPFREPRCMPSGVGFWTPQLFPRRGPVAAAGTTEATGTRSARWC